MLLPLIHQMSLFSPSPRGAVAPAPTAHAGQRAERVNQRSRGTCLTLRSNADLRQGATSPTAANLTTRD
jgi:hypothetical protein